jgi:PAS domain-containing protein
VGAFGVSRRATPDEILSAEQFVDLFDHADVGLAILDDQLRYLALNPFLARIHGSSIESHIGKRLQDVVGGLTTQLEPAYKAVVATGHPVLKYEVKGAVSAGTEAGHWIDNLFPLKDAKGRVKKVCAVVAEATSGKNVTEILADPRLVSGRTVLRSWKEIADYAGACIKTVQRWEQFYGFPIRRLKASKGAVVFTLTEDVDSWMRARTPTAKPPIKDEAFRSLFLTSPIPTLIVTNEQIVTDANVAMTDLLRAERDDLIGRPLKNICKSISGESSREWNMSQYDTISTGFYMLHRADGTVFESEYIMQNLAPGSRSIRLMNISRDISTVPADSPNTRLDARNRVTR